MPLAKTTQLKYAPTITHILPFPSPIFYIGLVILYGYFRRFFLSVAMIGLCVFAVFQWKMEANKIVGIQLRKAYKHFVNNKIYWLVSIPFWLVLFTGIYSNNDFGYLLERLRIRVPFLVLPFAFACMPAFDKKMLTVVLYAFIAAMLIGSIDIGIRFLQDVDYYIDQIRVGKSLPTRISHVRFSLMTAFAALASFILYFQKEWQWKKWEQPLLLFSAIFLTFFLHVLSVRSGLVVFYLAAFLLLSYKSIILKKWAWLLGGWLLLASIPIIAINTLPTLKQKMDYIRWDMDRSQEGNWESLSDGQRITSLKIGWDIAKENPILGVGMGDLRYEVRQQYEKKYPNLPIENRLMPHNQWLSIFAGAGLLGLVLSFYAFFAPLFYKKMYQNFLALSFHLLFFLSFFVENTFETAIGTAFYLLPLLTFLNYWSNMDKE